MQDPVILPAQLVRADGKYRITPVDLEGLLSNSFDPGATDNAIRRHHAGKIGVAIRNKVRQAHERHILLLKNIVTEEVEAELSSASGSELEIATTRQQVLQRLITEKQSELSELRGALSKYFNFDPVSATDSTLFGEFIRHAGASLEHSAVQSFTDGLYTAYDAKTLAQVVQLLQQQEQAATATVALLHAQNAQQVAEAAIAEAIRRANSYSAIAVSSPVIVTAAGTVITNIARFSLLGAIQAAIGALVGLGAGVAAGLAVGTIAMLVPSRLGNGELPERYLLQTPLEGLDPDLSKAMAPGNPTASHADLPFRFGSRTTAAGDSEIFVVKTDGQTVPAQVRILAATHDPQRNVYSVVTADIPSRTLTWTPIAQPPDASTTLPAERPEPPVYEGATLTPVEVRIDSYPEVADASLDDYIIVFPADSGLPPLYVMFRDRREEPGTGNGNGVEVGESWSKHVETLEGAPIPAQVATLLKGLSFRNWTAYRNALWKAVADDPFLSAQFGPGSIGRMRRGRPPLARVHERVGNIASLQIHHKIPISEGGDVYNSENLTIVTPKQHHTIHYGENNEKDNQRLH
ncbi:S-type pyocin domain-containing protein [Pseudomonas sp. NY15463]|uniref:S-type pyocin domain-containing protein n=1 Tax=Pseudomonas sp. NY15463 TaxID=3400361 RepID=UPI003A8A3FEC